MKRMSKLSPISLLIALMSMAVSGDLNAQGFVNDAKVYQTDGNGVVYQFEVEVDSTESYTSKSFSFAEYDAESYSTYPIYYGKVASSVWGVPRVKAIIEGTYGDGNWFTVDTVAVEDSVETYNTGSLNLNNVRCAAYRVKFSGVTSWSINMSDTVYKLSLYAYRKDPDLIRR